MNIYSKSMPLSICDNEVEEDGVEKKAGAEEEAEQAGTEKSDEAEEETKVKMKKEVRRLNV